MFKRPFANWLRRRLGRLAATPARKGRLRFGAFALGLTALGSTALVTQPRTSPGWPNCAVLGDSLAVGVGLVLPGCRIIARGGITSSDYLAAFPSSLEAALVVVSLGANDGQGQTLETLRALRARLRASQVVWLLPNIAAVRPMMTEIARQAGDRVIDTSPFVGADNLHPNLTGYRAIVALLPRAPP